MQVANRALDLSLLLRNEGIVLQEGHRISTVDRIASGWLHDVLRHRSIATGADAAAEAAAEAGDALLEAIRKRTALHSESAVRS